MIPATEENIYRVLWHARGLLIDRIIDGGEGELARVLGLFQAHSRRYELQLSYGEGTDEVGRPARFLSGGGSWHPRPHDASRHPDCTTLPDGMPLYAWTKIAGNLAIRPTHGSYDYLVIDHLLDICRDQRFDAVVELGSGIGERLFELYLAGGPRGIPYFGAEVWETGRRVASRMAALEAGLDFRSVEFDLNRPDYGFLQGFEKVLVFSNAAICCVENLPLDFATRMAKAAPRMVGLHYEYISHQFQAHIGNYAAERKLNRDFMALMKDAQANGQLRINYVGPDVYITSSSQSMTVLQWSSSAGDGQ